MLLSLFSATMLILYSSVLTNMSVFFALLLGTSCAVQVFLIIPFRIINKKIFVSTCECVRVVPVSLSVLFVYILIVEACFDLSHTDCLNQLWFLIMYIIYSMEHGGSGYINVQASNTMTFELCIRDRCIY
jgi:hypothetical protein